MSNDMAMSGGLARWKLKRMNSFILSVCGSGIWYV